MIPKRSARRVRIFSQILELEKLEKVEQNGREGEGITCMGSFWNQLAIILGSIDGNAKQIRRLF